MEVRGRLLGSKPFDLDRRLLLSAMVLHVALVALVPRDALGGALVTHPLLAVTLVTDGSKRCAAATTTAVAALAPGRGPLGTRPAPVGLDVRRPVDLVPLGLNESAPGRKGGQPLLTG